jgi:lipopolysaccharide heptosyltransferase II
LSPKRAKTAELPESPRILVMETGLIGELLVITPALRAIRKHRPNAHVTVMVRPGSAAVLVGSPYVDRLLPLVSRERKGFWGVMHLASWVRSQNFDAAFVLHTSFRSALIALMGTVPVRAGLASEGRGFLLTHKTPRDREAYEVDEHLAVLGLLGVPPDGRELEIFLTEEERKSARTLLGPTADGRALVGLHPGASRGIRRWPVRNFVALGGLIERELGAAPVFFFGPRENDLARAVVRLSEDEELSPPRVLRPGNVRILAAAFELMDAVVTNNTGPMHVAAAVRTPGVFIHGPTPVRRWQPPGDRYVAVFAEDIECRPCDSPQCSAGALHCMTAITPERVLDRLKEVI